MNKAGYLQQLRNKLHGFDEDIVSEMLRDYEEHFEIGYAQNKSDDEIIASLGSIDDLVKEMEQCYERHQSNRVYVDLSNLNSSIHDTNNEFRDMGENIKKEFSGFSFDFDNIPKDHGVQRFKFAQDIKRIIVNGFYGEIEVYKGSELYLEYECSGSKKAKFMAPLCTEVIDGVLHISINDLSSFKGITKHRPDMQMKLYIPENIELLQFENCLDTISIADVNLDALQIHVTSNDIFVNDSIIKRGSIVTSSGDVEIVGCKSKQMNITTISGDITCRNIVFDKVETTSISGDINCEDGHIRMILAKSVSGDITVECEECEAYSISTTSGDVELDIYRGAAIKATTVSGDIDITLMDEVSGFVASLNTKSGDIDVSYGELAESELSSGVYQYAKEHRECNVKMQINTMSGDISIHGDM